MSESEKKSADLMYAVQLITEWCGKEIKVVIAICTSLDKAKKAAELIFRELWVELEKEETEYIKPEMRFKEHSVPGVLYVEALPDCEAVVAIVPYRPNTIYRQAEAGEEV